MAIEFVHGRSPAAPALAALTGVFLAVVEKTSLSDAQRDAFAAKLKNVTGQDATTKVLGGARPVGTVPAGPGARFAVQLPKKP
jgi:hypothetical protein